MRLAISRTENMLVAALLIALFGLGPHSGNSAAAQDDPAEEFLIALTEVADPKAVFATVESVDVVPARARIGGTLAELVVDEGDRVEEGAVIAVVAAETLALRITAINARISAVEAERDQAQIDLRRSEDLASRGVLPRSRLDEVRTRLSVLSRQYEEVVAERSVIREQVEEGDVLAPAGGVVLAAPVRPGEVILPGEEIARIAAENYVLRLQLPERHARHLSEGDMVRVGGRSPDDEGRHTGRIIQVYPQIQDGRVIADAVAEGVGDFFVGQRVRVWVETDVRQTYIAPAHFIETRYGVDFVQIRGADGEIREVAVLRGRDAPSEAMANGVEILSGVADGDVLVAP